MFYIAESCSFGKEGDWLKLKREMSTDPRIDGRKIVEVAKGDLQSNFTYRLFQVINRRTHMPEGMIMLTILPAMWGKGNSHYD